MHCSLRNAKVPMRGGAPNFLACPQANLTWRLTPGKETPTNSLIVYGRVAPAQRLEESLDHKHPACPDNRYLLAANQGTKDDPSTTVSIVDTSTLAVVGTIETGEGAHGIVIDPESRYAYVTNIYDDNVAVLDIAGRRVVKTIASGDGPNGISYSTLAPATPSAASIAISMPAHKDDGMDGMDE